MLAFVSSTQGYLQIRMLWFERLVMLAGALLMIKPGWETDLIGIAILATCLLFHRYRVTAMATATPA
ncbi:MAG: hypothetical protein PF501_07090 [Salinisphaera sp.]|nr:hypothetical protein [Salinisphaera sp.]